MQISAAQVKVLREKTSAGVMDCRDALLETQGDLDKASELLRQKGLAKLEKKAEHVASQGLVDAYIHPGGRLGALVEVNCETDFVARTDEFRELAHNLALQVAATSPLFLSSEGLPEEADLNPEEVCLLQQRFIKEETKTVQEIIDETAAKVGEKVMVRRFARFELGR